MTPAATFKWADKFWDDAYNKAASNVTEIVPNKKLVESDSSSSDAESSDESTMSDFVILKSKSRQLLKASKRIKKRAE